MYHNYLVANIGVGHLFPGGLLLTTHHGPAETLGYFSLTYRFRIDQHAVVPQSVTERATSTSSH